MSCIIDLSPLGDSLDEDLIATAIKALGDRFVRISAAGIIIGGKQSHLRIVLELEAHRETAIFSFGTSAAEADGASGGLV